MRQVARLAAGLSFLVSAAFTQVEKATIVGSRQIQLALKLVL